MIAITSFAAARSLLVPTEVQYYCNRETYTKTELRADILHDRSKGVPYTLIDFSILAGCYKSVPLVSPISVTIGPQAQYALAVSVISTSKRQICRSLHPELRAFPALLIKGALEDEALATFNALTEDVLDGHPRCIRTAESARRHEREWEFVVNCFELQEVVRLFNTDEAEAHA